jgi:hypothetical protein
MRHIASVVASLVLTVSAFAGQIATAPCATAKFHGRVEAGKSYTHRFGPNFEFILAADGSRGWTLAVDEVGGDIDLAQMTPPLQGPRPAFLYASAFLPGANAPGRHHSLIFPQKSSERSPGTGCRAQTFTRPWRSSRE